MKDLINAVGELLKEVLKVVLLGDEPPHDAPINTHMKRPQIEAFSVSTNP